MKPILLVLMLALLAFAPAKGAYFCPPGNEDCTYEEVLRKHKLPREHPEGKAIWERLEEVVGTFWTGPMRNDEWYKGTANFVQTDRCQSRNILLSNAHNIVDRKSDTLWGREGAFCRKANLVQGADGETHERADKPCNKFSLSKRRVEEWRSRGLISLPLRKVGGDHKDFVIVPLNTSIEARPILLERLRGNEYRMDKDVLIGGFSYEEQTLTIVHKCRATDFLKLTSYEEGFILAHNCPTKKGTSGGLLLYEEDLRPIALHRSGKTTKGTTYDDSHSWGDFNVAMLLDTIIEAINSNCEFLKGHATR